MAFQEVGKDAFRKTWGALISCNHRVESRPFAFLPTTYNGSYLLLFRKKKGKGLKFHLDNLSYFEISAFLF